jgi:hypothetical protein
VRIRCGFVLQPFAPFCPLRTQQFESFVRAWRIAWTYQSYRSTNWLSLGEVWKHSFKSSSPARQEELATENMKLCGIFGKTVLKPSEKVKCRDGHHEWSGVGSRPSWLSAKKALGEDIENIEGKGPSGPFLY